MDRRTFISGLGASIALGPAALTSTARALADGPSHAGLTKILRENMLTPEMAQAWHAAKDSQGGPTMAGSPSWKNYLELCERELKARGVVDLLRNPWQYERWYTTEWPDDSAWSLHIDGQKIRIPAYGANSGSTPSAGITCPLVVYQPDMSPEAVKGHIVVVPAGAKPPQSGDEGRGARSGASEPRPSLRLTGDYEYLSDADTFPNPRSPRAVGMQSSPIERMGLGPFTTFLEEAGAAGMLFAMDLSYDAAAGTYTFGVPALHELPTLYLDRDSAAKVIAAANAGKQGTLRLVAKKETIETYQLFGYLPGRNYGQPEDEQVLLITHTDGPSISQENGALGILGMVHYFSKIPQAARPRTIMVFLDCRHYMPGAERAFSRQDYSQSHPELYKRVVAAMGIEHLGQITFTDEPGKPFAPTGLAELSSLWITNNSRLVDMALKSAKENKLKRVQVQCPGRPGMHGGEQGPWSGLGGIARRLSVPGASTMGLMTAYWSTRARLDAFDKNHFCDQVATMSQLCGELMAADMAQLRGEPAAARS